LNLSSSGIYWDILGYSGIYCDILGYTGIYWDILGYDIYDIYIYWDKLMFFTNLNLSAISG
jgi:hypothetical protein